MNKVDSTLYWVLVMMGLGTVMIVAGVVTFFHIRLPAPPLLKPARSEWFAYRVVLKTKRRRRLYLLALITILCGCVVQAIVGTRHAGWGETVLMAGRGLAIAVAIVIASQIVITSPDDPYAIRKPLDPRFDVLAPDVRRMVLRLLLAKLIARRLLVALTILLLGVWLRFGLSLEPFVAWLSLLTVLYAAVCIGEIGSRRLWRDAVADDVGDGENA